jgi:methanogenic corrinoid protein MtbC1
VRPPDQAPVDALLELIEARRRDEVVSVVRSTARDGGLEAAIELLTRVQTEVGLRWQTERWSVADEHAATAIVDLALTAAALEAAPATPSLPSIVVACTEEEWHILPARMLAEQLRDLGWDVVFLGASTPGGHLERFVAQARPAAVAVSCSIALHMPGARRSIAACHAAGAPVVAGGAGFGPTSRRAAALGADAWAATAGDAARVAAAWLESSPALGAPLVDDRAQLALGAERPAIVDAAMSELMARYPPLAGYSAWQLEKTREDFEYIVRFVEAAMLTGDDSIVTEFSIWLSSILTARDLPHGLVPVSIRVLRGHVPDSFSEARRLLDLAAESAESAG